MSRQPRLHALFAALGIASTAVAGEKPPAFPNGSPFGIGSCHANNWGAPANQGWIPAMAAIGVTNHRCCNTGWSEVEPERGQWRWEALDAQMDYLRGQKIEFGGILMGNPKWSQGPAGFGLPVNNLEGWSRYVGETVKHAKGRIRLWEVWNEPPNGTGQDQTPADYAKIVVAAYEAAKAADPDCLIGLAAKSVHVNYLEQVIRAGARDHFDYLTLHPYEVLDGVGNNLGTESVFLSIVPNVRKMLAKQDPARAGVPIIFTELGSDASKGLERQAAALVKAYTMGIAQGVACIQWFEGRDGDSGPMGLLDREGKPRPAYAALAAMIKHLGAHPESAGWALLNDRDPAFFFRGAAGPVMVAWTRRGEPDTIRFPNEVEIVDPLTGEGKRSAQRTLGAMPVIVLAPPESWVAEARQRMGRPLPWGGDYSKADSVSFTAGEADGERGLHTLSGESVAQAVVAYGGSARAGGVPGGNLFVVDPGFLSYDATPIEITAEVRRNEKNDNAGFKLVYESTDGFKTAGGWFTIPDNQQWHTVRWRIDDPQFVCYWGYNFALESDGSPYNKYYLRKVTVTKAGGEK